MWGISTEDILCVCTLNLKIEKIKRNYCFVLHVFVVTVELAMIMDRLYGGVCYAGIDTDPELKYPKGAGRVAFASQQSYIAAISARFVQLQHGDIDKRVSAKKIMHNTKCRLPSFFFSSLPSFFPQSWTAVKQLHVSRPLS